MKMSNIEIRQALNSPPKIIVDLFESKGFAISHNWWETWKDANAKAFTVAKASRLEILRTIKKEVDNIFAEGITAQTFVKRLEPLLREQGWWGQSLDEAGNVIQLGSRSRLQTIYNTNLRIGRAYGRYQSQIANADNRPYWRYRHLRGQPDPRPTHAALDYSVFLYNDPFWNTHYPPSGYHCHCWVEALTEDQFGTLQGEGVELQTSAKKLRKVDQTVRLDRVSGEIIETKGTQFTHTFTAPITGKVRTVKITPDPGWSYNPGNSSVWDGGPTVPTIVAPAQRTFADYGQPPASQIVREAKDLPADPPDLPAKQAQVDKIRQIETALNLPKNGRRKVETPVDNVIIDAGQIEHTIDRIEAQRMETTANLVIPTLQNPYEVWVVEQELGRTRRLFIGIYGTQAAIIQEGLDGSVVWQKVEIDKLDQYRTGALIYTSK